MGDRLALLDSLSFPNDSLPRVPLPATDAFASTDAPAAPIKEPEVTIQEVHNTPITPTSACAPTTCIKEIKLLPTKWRKVFLLKLDATLGGGVGEAVGLYFPNSVQLAKRLAQRLLLPDATANTHFTDGDGDAAAQTYTFTRISPRPYSFTGSLLEFLCFGIDMSALPPRALFRALATRCPPAMQPFFTHLSSPAGTAAYLALAARPTPLLDILESTDMAIPVTLLVQYCDPLRPRYYSLINRAGEDGEVLLGVHHYARAFSAYAGHGSSFALALASVKPGSPENSAQPASNNTATTVAMQFALPYHARPSQLLSNLAGPRIVCFCTGTGIAPAIGMIKNMVGVTEWHMVYGFRQEEDDLSTLLKGLPVPVTRASSAAGQRVQEFVNILNEFPPSETQIFVCGNTRMQQSLFKAIQQSFPAFVEQRRIFFDSWR